MVLAVRNVRPTQTHILQIEVRHLLSRWIEAECLTEQRLRVDCGLAVRVLLEAAHERIQLI